MSEDFYFEIYDAEAETNQFFSEVIKATDKVKARIEVEKKVEEWNKLHGGRYFLQG